MIGKYNLQLMPFGVPFAGSENWDGCVAKGPEACTDPKPSAWTKSEVHTVVTDRFKNVAGPAMDYFAKRIWPGGVMGSMLVFMEDSKLTDQTQLYISWKRMRISGCSGFRLT
jgi:glycine betaine/proline transport system substrate-binding protein